MLQAAISLAALPVASMPVVPDAICAVAVRASKAVKEKAQKLLAMWLKRNVGGVVVFIINVLIASITD